MAHLQCTRVSAARATRVCRVLQRLQICKDPHHWYRHGCRGCGWEAEHEDQVGCTQTWPGHRCRPMLRCVWRVITEPASCHVRRGIAVARGARPRLWVRRVGHRGFGRAALASSSRCRCRNLRIRDGGVGVGACLFAGGRRQTHAYLRMHRRACIGARAPAHVRAQCASTPAAAPANMCVLKGTQLSSQKALDRVEQEHDALHSLLALHAGLRSFSPGLGDYASSSGSNCSGVLVTIVAACMLAMSSPRAS